MKIKVTLINLQSGVAITKGNFQYVSRAWRYWFPHPNKPICDAGDFIKEEKIDLVAVTEISEKSLRTGFRSQIEILAAVSQIPNCQFFSPQKIGNFFFCEGNAVLSTYQIVETKSYPLSSGFMKNSLDEAIIAVGNEKISFFVAHLALVKRHRQTQIKEITKIIKERTNPIILAGDFNERDSDKLEILSKETQLTGRFTDKTFPSWNPEYKLDNIFFSGHFSLIDGYVPEYKFSDHLPLIATFELLSI